MTSPSRSQAIEKAARDYLVVYEQLEEMRERYRQHLHPPEGIVNALCTMADAAVHALRAALAAQAEETRPDDRKLPTQRIMHYLSWEEAEALHALAQPLVDDVKAGKLAKRVCDLLRPGTVLTAAPSPEEPPPGDAFRQQPWESLSRIHHPAASEPAARDEGHEDGCLGGDLCTCGPADVRDGGDGDPPHADCPLHGHLAASVAPPEEPRCPECGLPADDHIHPDLELPSGRAGREP